MLKHEETFKEQVYELHRLYRIQKMLMKSIQSSSNGRKQETWNKNNLHHHLQQQSSRITSLDLERPAEEFIAESNCSRMLEIIDESEIELTLGPPANYSRRKKKPVTPLTSDSGPSFSSSSAESSHVNRTTTKEGFLQGTDMRNKMGIDIEEQLKQQPPWMFQVLSL